MGIYFKKLAHLIIGADKFKISKAVRLEVKKRVDIVVLDLKSAQAIRL